MTTGKTVDVPCMIVVRWLMTFGSSIAGVGVKMMSPGMPVDRTGCGMTVLVTSWTALPRTGKTLLMTGAVTVGWKSGPGVATGTPAASSSLLTPAIIAEAVGMSPPRGLLAVAAPLERTRPVAPVTAPRLVESAFAIGKFAPRTEESCPINELKIAPDRPFIFPRAELTLLMKLPARSPAEFVA